MTVVKPLKFRPGNIGVSHQVAEGVNGQYHVWGDHHWAGPSFRRGDDADYAPDAIAACNAAHVKHLKRFIGKSKT